MSMTTQCPACQLVLTVPDAAGGRRLKCPKCGGRFYVGQGGAARPASQAPGVGPSSVTIPASSHGHRDLPTAAGDLRETFDLPLLMDEDTPVRPAARSAGVADALFRDEDMPARRRTLADARSESRRCPECGGFVPAGMSLCSRCGLDLDTGQQIELEEELDEAPVEPVYESGPPFGIVFIGSVAMIASLVLAVFCFLQLGESLGGLALGVVCLFGIVASVQFLRGKSFKLLLVALGLAGAIDVVALIALPVFQADESIPAAEVQEDVLPDGEEIADIPPIMQRLNTRKIGWGVALLLVDVALLIYLSTPGIRRHFHRTHHEGVMPPGYAPY